MLIRRTDLVAFRNIEIGNAVISAVGSGITREVVIIGKMHDLWRCF